MGVALSVVKGVSAEVGLFGLSCLASSAVVWANRGCRVASLETCSTPKSGPCWHECRAVYSTGLVETKVNPYLLANGELGVI